MSSSGLRLLLLGATGHVGRAVLDLALADARVASVVAPGRRSLATQPKLLAPRVDFAALPAAAWWQVDAAVCTLGASLMAAPSREAFRRIDHGHVLAAARMLREADTPTFVLLSSLGADPSSRFFYARVKGELERDLGSLGFKSLTLVRPSMIGGRRTPPRRADALASALFAAFGPVVPRDWRMVQAQTVARGLFESALAPRTGRTVVGARDLTVYSDREGSVFKLGSSD